MTETGKLKVGSSLEAMMERHIAAQLAIIDAVREWTVAGPTVTSAALYMPTLCSMWPEKKRRPGSELSDMNLGTIGKQNSS